MSIRRHAGYNLIGYAIPLALSLITIPLYLKLVGPERYGVLAIAWLLLGYFGLFDLGLGRATSFRIASLKGEDAEARASAFWSAVWVNVGMGVVGGAVLWGAGALFIGSAFKVDEAIRSEAISALPLLATAVSVATLTGVLTGALQGREKFLETNIVSTASTALFHLAPLAVAAWFGPTLIYVLAAAIGARLLGMLVLGYLCWRELLDGVKGRPNAPEVKTLLGYGGWVSLTSLFGPFLVMLDRFAIGAVMGAGSVAIYTVAYQLTQRMAVVPTAITSALFPRMSAVGPDERAALSDSASLALICIMTLLALPMMVVMEPFMNLWVGQELAAQAAPIARVLVLAFWWNAHALLPFTALQASGRPDTVTKIILFEIPIYLVLLYFLSIKFGLIGYAIAFCLRCAMDYAILTAFAYKKSFHIYTMAVNLAILMFVLWIESIVEPFSALWWLAAVGVGTLCVAFNVVRAPAEIRQQVVERIRRVTARGG